MKTYRTKEVAAIAGVDKMTIFRWEKSGIISKSKRDHNGYRIYSQEVLQEILLLSGKNRHEIYAFVNQKGGTGKTTTALNLGASLAELGQKVLVVDLDSQANLTYGLGYETDAAQNTYHLMTDPAVPVSQITIATSLANLYLAPGSIVMANADFELRQIVMGEEILRGKMEEARKDYNYIFIDCPPSLGPIVGSAVLAADGLVIPVPLQQFSVIGLKNLIMFLSVILQRTKSQCLVHILPNMVDKRIVISNSMFEELKQNFAGEILPEIRVSASLPESQAHRQPVIHYKKTSRGAKDFRKLADYMLKEVKPVVDHF
jgi:chromosome partitioning protein